MKGFRLTDCEQTYVIKDTLTDKVIHRGVTAPKNVGVINLLGEVSIRYPYC